MSKKTDDKKQWRKVRDQFVLEYNKNQVLMNVCQKAMAFVKDNCTPEKYAELLTLLNMKEPTK